jgi:FAD:protein FMN transferase
MRHRCFAAFFVLYLACLQTSVGAEPRRYSADAMGGAFSIILYSSDPTKADAAAAAAFAELTRLDSVLSNYRPESEWSRVNREAAQHPVKVSEELFELLAACGEYTRRSEGAFDISVGPLMRAWGFRRGEVDTAGSTAAKDLSPVGFGSVRLDASARTVRFLRPGMELDPGGIGKGYAVDRMVTVLRNLGIDCALVSAAGSSIFGLGAPPGSDGWTVAIEDPKSRLRKAGEALLRDSALSTSGTREKFVRSAGRRYGHIMDPRTGRPAVGAALVAVAGATALDTEAWTKAVFINGRRWAASSLPQGCRAFFCDESGACGWLERGR